MVTWALLVAATVTSWWVGHEHTGDLAVLLVLGITFLKVWAVGRRFMELQQAPAVLRGLFDGYVVVVPLGLAAVYLLA